MFFEKQIWLQAKAPFEEVGRESEREQNKVINILNSSGDETLSQNRGRDTSQAEKKSKFPWISFLCLQYPIAAMIDWGRTDDATPVEILGNGLANLGYLLFITGIISDKFGAFGLNGRSKIFITGLAAFIVGGLLINNSENLASSKNIMTLPSQMPLPLLFSCIIFIGFVGIHQRHAWNFRGASPTQHLALNISTLLGSISLLGLFAYYFYVAPWHFPFILFVIGIFLGGILFAYFDYIIGQPWMRLLGFAAWPAAAFWTFLIIKNLPT